MSDEKRGPRVELKGQMTDLMDRIRRGSEAAPWVVEEVKHLCAEVERLRNDRAVLEAVLEWIDNMRATWSAAADYDTSGPDDNEHWRGWIDGFDEAARDAERDCEELLAGKDELCPLPERWQRALDDVEENER